MDRTRITIDDKQRTFTKRDKGQEIVVSHITNVLKGHETEGEEKYLFYHSESVRHCLIRLNNNLLWVLTV